MRRSITVALFFGLVACVAPGGPGEPAGSTSSPILSGTASGVDQDAVVRLETAIGGGKFICTGTLVAPNLVLTARHCIADLRSLDGFVCDDSGGVAQGDARFAPDRAASELKVYTSVGGSPAAQGKKIFHSDGSVVCSNDLAMVLLDKSIPNAKTMAIRLDGKARAGETFTAVGWGLTETGDAGVRFQRKSVSVLRVGPSAGGTKDLPVPPNDFESGEAICEGDSGGPAIASSGAVIGVVSRGGNGTGGTEAPGYCKGAKNHYTSTGPFKALILQAFSEAGATPQAEAATGGGKESGAACTADSECLGGLCVSGGTGKVCSQACDDGNCPSGFTCARESTGKSFCAAGLPRGGGGADGGTGTAKPGGCAVRGAGVPARGGVIVALALAAAALGTRRRRAR